MGYSDLDQLAINTIRLLAVCLLLLSFPFASHLVHCLPRSLSPNAPPVFAELEVAEMRLRFVLQPIIPIQ